jgi:hypothetical protein
LGLAIVGRIIETHRGNIRIKSKIGRGTSIHHLTAGEIIPPKSIQILVRHFLQNAAFLRNSFSLRNFLALILAVAVYSTASF